jgi:hypothetical protein
MYQLSVTDAMRMNVTHVNNLNSSLSTAHHPTLGIVTQDSIMNANMKDTSAIANNPPVAGSAGASDPQVAALVGSMRDMAMPFVSRDRVQETGRTDHMKFNPDDTNVVPPPEYGRGIAMRLRMR